MVTPPLHTMLSRNKRHAMQGADRKPGGFFLIGGVLLFFDRAM